MSKRKRRMDPDDRRDLILDAAVDLAKERGFLNIRRDEIAIKAGVSMGLVTRYFGTMVKLKRDVMRMAIRDEVLSILAQGIAIKDVHALKAPNDLQQRAVASLSN